MRFLWLPLLLLLGCNRPKPADDISYEWSPLAKIQKSGRNLQFNLSVEPCFDDYRDEFNEAVGILSAYGIYYTPELPSIYTLSCAYDYPKDGDEWVGLTQFDQGVTVRMLYFDAKPSPYRVSLLMHEFTHLLGVGHNKYENSVMYPQNLPNIFFTEADIAAIDSAWEKVRPLDLGEIRNDKE